MNAPNASELTYHLGGDVFVLPVPSGVNGVLQVGSLADLPVWSTAGTAAHTLVQARGFARRGALGLVIGHDAVANRLALAVTVQPVRLAMVEAGDRDALPLQRLSRAARNRRETSIEQAITMADALDTDAAGRRTFKMLHELIERAIEMLPARASRDDRHAWALAQVTRLLFLRFVESEGWLDGNPRFLADVFDRCLRARRDPTTHLLHPLFFGTLNRSWADRSRYARAFGAIPFLNGGLFEPHAVERKHAFHLPVAFWEHAFTALVDRVDVALDDESLSGRVTPELLGRVFEGVMHPLERKQRGAFFTPPDLVNAIVRQALACHLAPKLGRSESLIERALDDPDPELQRTLLDVTVIDPAAGSGAFLVGALHLLHGPGVRNPSMVRHLITRRLYGVDHHPGAVRVCELRLWLEVLRAMRGRAPASVPPLPNLNATIRAGDSLIDPLGSLSIDRRWATAIRTSQRSIGGRHGAPKRRAIADARAAERSALLDALDLEESAIDGLLREAISAAHAPTLFGGRGKPDPVARRNIARLRLSRRQVRSERRRVARDASSTPFALAAAFAPVVTGRGGFDLVVGNPPWVRAEDLPNVMRDRLAERYKWWRTSGTGWRHLPDLSVAFLERGFELLAPGGTLAFLLPAKIATAGYATVARAALTARSTLHRVADLGNDSRAGFEATTYPLAMVASKCMAPPGQMVRLGLRSDDPAHPQASWQDGACWSTTSPETQRIAARLMEQHGRLGDSITPQLGVKTGANDVFLNPPEELRSWTRPAIRGRDILPFAIRESATMLWPADARGNPWRVLPDALVAHFASRDTQLQRRADHQTGPAWQLFRTRAATAAHRVVWRDLAPSLQAAVIENEVAVPLNSCYVAAVSSAIIADSLAAWLNSMPIRAIARMRAEPAAGGCARFAARTVADLPWPAKVAGHPVLASCTHSAALHDVQPMLDACVQELLGLTDAEMTALADVAAHRR